jgi:Spy/CpxP family protein refolding chaperone
MTKYCVFIILTISIKVVNAQHHSHISSETRNEIKALTSEQINGYLSGEGMGLAKAAELNHYPGPKHVLDLANELNLNQVQIDSTQKFFDLMKEDAVRIGERIIEKEKQLELLFNSNKADNQSVRNLVKGIAEFQGELRFVHLNAHIQQKSILTAEQISLYDKLRGYSIQQ